jgi:hypothetical protein
MKTAIIILAAIVVSCSALAQGNYTKIIDSLRYIVCLPDENFYPFGDSISERIIKQGETIVPALIEKILDVTETEMKIVDVHTITVSDVAITLIEQIYLYHYKQVLPIREIIVSEFYNGIDDGDFTYSIYYKTFFSYKKEQNYKNRVRFYNRIIEWYEKDKK